VVRSSKISNLGLSCDPGIMNKLCLGSVLLISLRLSSSIISVVLSVAAPLALSELCMYVRTCLLH
jgi:hypothetical protein